jgi:hypothetical protein
MSHRLFCLVAPFSLIALTNLVAFGSETTESASSDATVRGRYLITVADDFIVDVYHNGVKVPDTQRELLEERFGATVERINVEVHKGDWLVFHVVNNRLRWGGTSYFGAASCFGNDEFGFVSGVESGCWSACDSPRDAQKFIARKNFLRDQKASLIENPWGDGTPLMQAYAGHAWNGQPIWGHSPSTWIKVVAK